jgi:hypothetical protein
VTGKETAGGIFMTLRLPTPLQAGRQAKHRQRNQSNHNAKMKRSERLQQAARHQAMLATVFLSGALAPGVWAVVALMAGNALGGACLLLAATIALCLSGAHWREAQRLRRVAESEAQWEYERAIRPRYTSGRI